MLIDPLNPPVCDCHGVEMLWNKDARYRAGGFWFCRPKHVERVRHYRAVHPEKTRESNARQIRVGRFYLGTCGFTDSEREVLCGTPE